MAPRIEPDEVERKMHSGSDLLLVCAYEDDKFCKYHLEGAIPLSQFKAMEDSLPMEREIVFYCD